MTDLRSKFFSTGNHRLDETLGEFARDVSDELGKFVQSSLVEFTSIYTQPMPVGFDHEPKMVFVGRVRLDATPESSVAHGSTAHFVWDAPTKTLNITGIDTLTPGTKYRFNMLMVG